MVEGLPEGFLGNLLRRVDVADYPDDGGDDAPLLETEDIRHMRLDIAAPRLSVVGRSHGPIVLDPATVLRPSTARSPAMGEPGADTHHMGQIGRTSTKPPSRSGIFRAHSTASSLVAHSIR